MYIDQLDDIVNGYNNTYHSTIKIKPTDVKSNTWIDFVSENNAKDLKLEADDHIIISKYKHIFAKCYIQNWSEELFVV